MDRLDALEVFLQVAATGSFAAAADRLRVDPATVTKRVAYLEALLERRLFQRSTRRVTLTAEGEALLSQAAELQDRAQAFFAKDGRAAISGVVRIRCSHSLASFGLAALLERFSLEHPAVQIELQASEKLRPIVETGADLAITVEASPEPGAVAHRLGPCGSLFVASKAYWGDRPLPVRATDWPQLRLLPLAHEKAWQADGLEVEITQKNAPVRYGNAWLAYQAALRGTGVARLPAVVMRSDLAAGRLVALLPEAASALSVWAVMPSRRWVKPAVRALLGVLQAHYAHYERPMAEPS